MLELIYYWVLYSPLKNVAVLLMTKPHWVPTPWVVLAWLCYDKYLTHPWLSQETSQPFKEGRGQDAVFYDWTLSALGLETFPMVI